MRGLGRGKGRRIVGGLSSLLLLAAGAVGVGAQGAMEEQAGPSVSVSTADALRTPFDFDESGVSPGGAFLRGLLLPGWGHAGSRSYARGGFYVAAQSGTLWMLGKALHRRGEASRYLEMEREVVLERLLRQGMERPEALLEADRDPRVMGWEELRDSRGQQVEDWAAAAIFITLLGAVDAFVAAHLADYPEPLSITLTPGTGGEGWGVGLRLPVGIGRR